MGISGPWGIAAGPDGALWFTNELNNSIGRITTSGTVTNYTDASINQPASIAAGPDGALWWANSGNNSIGRITTSGTVTSYADASINGPWGIAAGPDGGLWFTNSGNNSIGRITTSGTVTNYTGTGISEPLGIAAGPDGALWFTSYRNNAIGRITAPSAPGAVSDIVIDEASSSVISVSWRPPQFPSTEPYPTTYNFGISPAPQGGVATMHDIGSRTAYNVGGIVSGTTYRVSVSATNSTGTGPVTTEEFRASPAARP